MSTTPHHDTPTPPRLERLPAVLARTGLSRASIYRKLAAGDFVKPVRIGERSIAFIASEVDDWIAARAAERDQQAGTAK